ncbi:hypothetical protein D3C77_365970 [compost metagenome]
MNRQAMIQAATARYEQVLDAAIALGGWQFIKPRDRWSLYLMASYCYYEMDRGLMPDTLFDSLCRTLLTGGLGGDWWFTDLWDPSALVAGSGYHTFGRIDPTLQSIALAIRPAE